jgi:hypothetical protein
LRIFQENNNVDFYPLEHIQKLEQLGLIEKKRIENQEIVQVVPWLKARIFEEIIAKEGVDQYLRDLIHNENDKTLDKVQYNSLIATSHLANSGNRFISQIFSKLEESKLIYSKEKIETIEAILTPNKRYTVGNSSEKFDFATIEDTSLKIQEYFVNNLDNSRKKRYTKQEYKDITHFEIPEDIIYTEQIESSRYNEVVEALKSQISENTIQIILVKGSIILIKEDNIVLFIKNAKIGYSPSLNRRKKILKSEIIDAIHEIKGVIENNKSKQVKFNEVKCCLCNSSAKVLAYHESKGLILVCDECVKKYEIKSYFDTKMIIK